MLTLSSPAKAAADGVIFDVSRDFSVTNNPSGPWSYGYASTVGGAFTVFPVVVTSSSQNGVPVTFWAKNSSEPAVVYFNQSSEVSTSDNGQGVFPPGTIWFYAGVDGRPDNFAVIRFKLPEGKEGTYRLETIVRSYLDGDRSGDTDFHVAKNGTEIFGQFLPPRTGTSYTNTLILSAGDTIDFAVGRGQDGIQYGSGLKIEARLVAIEQPPVSPLVLSGLVEFSTDTAGNFDNRSVWNTRGGDSAVNLWLVRGTNLIGPFVNGPADSQAGISVPLQEGEHSFVLYGNRGGFLPHHGLNLFFNGSNSTPRISVFGPTQISPNPPYPTFAANRSSNTLTLGFQRVVGANTLSFRQGDLRVELTDYRWAGPDVYNLDRVSQTSASPDGGTDLIGRLTLNVTRVGSTSPTIVQQPEDQTVEAGGSVTFSVTAEGTSPLAYQWFHNGTEIRGATSSTLTLTSVHPPHAGDYSVRVSNATGSATSDAATLTVTPSSATFDLVRDYSTNANPAGPWSYGWKPSINGNLSLLPVSLIQVYAPGEVIHRWLKTTAGGPPGVNKHVGTVERNDGEGIYPPGVVWFGPGDTAADTFGVIRLTIPAGRSGNYKLESAVRTYLDGPISGDTDFHIVKNGQELFGRFMPGSSASGYTNIISLAEGDTLDFLVGRGQDNSSYATGLKIKATLSLTDEPPPPPPPRATFDVSRDFSTNSNPGGAWSYGYVSTLGGPFSLYTYRQYTRADNPVTIFNWSKNSFQPGAVYFNPSSETSIANNGFGVYPPGTVWFFAGEAGQPDNFAVIRLTIPIGSEGHYRLETSVRSHLDGELSGDTDFHVLKNGTEIFGQFMPPRSGTGYTNEIVVAAGDTIDFAVGRGQDGNLHGSGLKIKAALIPLDAPPPPRVVHDLERDYSTNRNPAGVWSYGWKPTLSGSFTLYGYHGYQPVPAPAVVDYWMKSAGAGASALYHNAGSVTFTNGEGSLFAPGTAWLAPGYEGNSDNFGAIRFSVPSGGGGLYRIQSAVRASLESSQSGDADFHVVWNGNEVFGEFLPPRGSGGYSNDLFLAEGDVVDFCVGRGADGRESGSALRIKALITLLDTGVKAPEIVLQPQSQSVYAGATVSFSVLANGSQPLTYQWLFNGTEIAGANQSTLALTSVQESQAGGYSVRISNAAGSSTSATATLAVAPPRPVTSAILSGLIEFSTDMAGNFDNRSVWNTRGGDTAVNLWVIRGTNMMRPFVNGPSDAQAGISIPLYEGINHFVLFGNRGGFLPHHGLNLFFNGNNNTPRISVFGPTQTSPNPPYPAFARNGSSNTLTLAFQRVAGANTLVFQDSDTRVELTHYRWAGPDVYNIDRVSQPVATPDGTTDLIGHFTLNATRVPPTPPTIVSQPQSQTVEAGGTVTFSVRTEGSSPFAYQWFHNGAEINGATAATLTLDYVQAADAGEYSVRVSNSAGSATSAPATLTVTTPPPATTAVLSGLVEFSTDNAGNFDNRSVWNTRGGDSAVNLWVVRGSDLMGPFINGPSDAQAGISIPLREGDNDFVLYGNRGGFLPTHGLNLFFNSNNVTPGISVFAPTQTSPSNFPPFSANGSSNTLTLAFQRTPGANTLVFEDAETRVELIAYAWAGPDVYNINRVSQLSATPDGATDLIGRFTLRVTKLTSENTPPVARIDVSPLAVLHPDQTEKLLIAGLDDTAAVVFDARGSTDADGDALSFGWFAAGEATPFSTAPLTTNSVPVGIHTVNLVVSDGQATGTATVTFEVITASEAVAAISDYLKNVSLPRKNAQALEASLRGAMQSLERGNGAAAVNQLSAFQNKVQSQVTPGNADLGEFLTDAAQSVIDALLGAE